MPCSRFADRRRVDCFPRKSFNYLFIWPAGSAWPRVAVSVAHSLFTQLDTFHYTTNCDRLTSDACFALCWPRGAGRGGLVGVVNGQLQCRTAGTAMGMAFVVFENGISACNFQQFASSTSTLLFAAPFRIRVLDIWCFITLVKCIQFNAPFSLHLASMPGRAAHGSDTLTSLHLSQQQQLLHLLPSYFVSNVEPDGAMLLHGSVVELPLLSSPLPCFPASRP